MGFQFLAAVAAAARLEWERESVWELVGVGVGAGPEREWKWEAGWESGSESE